MDDGRIEIPVTPDKIEQKDDGLRSSMGRASVSNSREKILPHHLRRSTGSCHDFCKYGRKHIFEEKGTHPILKGTSATPDQGKNIVQDAPLVKREKKKAIKSKPSPEPKAQLSGTTAMIKRETKIINQEAFSPLKKTNASKESVPRAKGAKKQLIKSQPSLDPKVKVSNSAKIKQDASLSPTKTNNANEAIGMNQKPVAVNSPSSLLNYPDSTGGRNSDVKMVTNAGNSKRGQGKELTSPRLTLSLKPSLRKAASLTTRNLKVQKAPSLPEKQSLHNEEKVIEKVLYMIETKPDKTSKLGLSSSTLSSSLHASSSPPSSPLLSCPEKENIISQSAFGEENDPASVCKRTQKMNQIESVKQEHKQRSSRLATNESSSQYNKTGKKSQLESPKKEYKRRPKGAETVHPEDKDLSRKLNFRGGKVVSLQSESNSSRRLRFKPGRVIGDNQNVKVDIRRSFKQRQNIAGESKAESEKVTLRHQTVNRKKDAQGLFNNVIEETASKLVETRKSKVKALVGAFETVISLQEGKTSATITK